MATVTKRDLVIELSNRSGITQSQAFDLFQHALDLITEELAKGNEVTLRRFGSFEVRVTKPKIGRNPNKPGSDMRIPPRAVVRFKPGNEMKAQVAAVLPKLAPEEAA
jgi:nucleoid DNA-binding protein